MSQTWVDNVYIPTHVADTDLDNMSDMFQTLKSGFSGTSAPANPLTGQLWYDSDDYVMRLRLAAGSWIGLMHGDVNQKIPVYRNDAMDGWAIDSSVTDKVIALKGGSTYTTGGTTAGSWTISGFADSGHTHGVGTYSNSHIHHMAYDAAGASAAANAISIYGGYLAYAGIGGTDPKVYDHTGSASAGMTGSSASGGATITQNGTWRVAAAVVTMQYLDL